MKHNILYISKRKDYDIGASAHRQALRDIFGEENVYVIDLWKTEREVGKNYIAPGIRTKLIYPIRWLQGNTRYIGNDTIKWIGNIIEKRNIDIVFVGESDFGFLVKFIRNHFPKTRIISFYHDISADLFRQRSEDAPWYKPWYKYLECNLTIMQERINVLYASENWVLHKNDANKFKKYYGKNPDYILPICVEPPHILDVCDKNSAKRKKILFVCSDYYPNIQGFSWFVDNVYNRLNGEFEITIVGTGSDILKKKYIDLENIIFVGRVDTLYTYYQESDIVIVPIFRGGGMKIKTLEAISYGKCILSTNEGLSGYWENIDKKLKNSLIFRSDNSTDWIDILNSLMSNNISKFNTDIYDLYIKYYSYPVLLRNFRIYISGKGIDYDE